MKRNTGLIVLVLLFVIFFPRLGFAQVNEFLLDPVDLEITPDDSTVQVNMNMNTIEYMVHFYVPLFAEGTSNPVLNSKLTGSELDANPPAFDPPSLVKSCQERIVVEYGPPIDPLLFCAAFCSSIPPSNGLFCRMFYDVEGPGTLTFRTAVHPTGGAVRMINVYYQEAPINWPAEGEVGSFEVTRMLIPGDVNWSGEINISDIVYIIAYLYKGGPAPVPDPSVADVNCDTEVTVSDVIYLINYLFKGGPAPGC